MAYYYSNQGGGVNDGYMGGYKDSSPGYQPTSVSVPTPMVTVTTEKKPWNWCATVWASIAVFLCPWCLLCNFISLLCLSHAYADHKAGDYGREKYKKNCGVGWLATAWVLGVLLIVALIVLGVLGFLTGYYCTILPC